MKKPKAASKRLPEFKGAINNSFERVFDENSAAAATKLSATPYKPNTEFQEEKKEVLFYADTSRQKFKYEQNTKNTGEGGPGEIKPPTLQEQGP